MGISPRRDLVGCFSLARGQGRNGPFADGAVLGKDDAEMSRDLLPRRGAYVDFLSMDTSSFKVGA